MLFTLQSRGSWSPCFIKVWVLSIFCWMVDFLFTSTFWRRFPSISLSGSKMPPDVPLRPAPWVTTVFTCDDPEPVYPPLFDPDIPLFFMSLCAYSDWFANNKRSDCSLVDSIPPNDVFMVSLCCYWHLRFFLILKD